MSKKPMGKEVIQTFALQQISRGEIVLGLTATDFGETVSKEQEMGCDIAPLDVTPKKKGDLLSSSSSIQITNSPKVMIDLGEEITPDTKYLKREGYLHKYPTSFSINPDPKKKWVIVKNSKISYYHHEKDKKAARTISLLGIDLQYDPTKWLIEISKNTEPLLKVRAPANESELWYSTIRRNADIANWRDEANLPI